MCVGRIQKKEIYLILFAGQSNMAGRGETCQKWPQNAPKLIKEGIAFEYRAITAPERLCVLEEPFGVLENRSDGINDVSDEGKPMKTGSLVTAFCNAFYEKTKTPVVAVSASKGGSRQCEWIPGAEAGYFKDAISRLLAAEKYLSENGFQIKKRMVVWTQGESDGDAGTSGEDYIRMFEEMWGSMKREAKLSTLFMIKTGECNIEGSYDRYQAIQKAQEEICDRNQDVILCSDLFCGMRKMGLMKDAFHYYQQGYNLCGENAGRKVGEILLCAEVENETSMADRLKKEEVET